MAKTSLAHGAHQLVDDLHQGRVDLLPLAAHRAEKY